jgi:hypothetical protein
MTARVYPSQQQTNLTTIGSLLVSYDEVNQLTNVSQVQCYVNSVERKLIHNNTDNLYSTFLSNGDIVRVLITTTSDDNEISVTRRDYTTDDQGGDMGIRNTYITGVTGNSPTTLEVTFTATTISLDYNFEYLVTAIVKYPPSPTPTQTVTQTGTPTPTPTTVPPTASPTPTPTITPTTTPAVLNSAGGKFDYDFQNFRTYPGTGLIFNDVTNSGNYATLITGATYQGSVSPYYYNMDSTYATSLYNPPNYYGYLYGGWFKVETTGVANVFMKKGDGLELGITSGNTIYGYFENVVGQTYTQDMGYMVPGYWYYIMSYYDYNLSGYAYAYVNGQLVAERSLWGISNPNLAGTGTPFIIGNGAPTQSFQLGEAECYAQFYGGIANVPTIVSTNFSRKLQFYSIYIPPTPTPTPTPTSTPVPVTLDYYYYVGDLGNIQWAKQVVGLSMSGNDGTTPCIAQPAHINSFFGTSTTGITTNFCSFTNTLRCVRGINYRRPAGAGGSIPRVNNSTIRLYKNGVLQQTQTLAAFNVPNQTTTTRYDTITFTGLTISGGETWRIEWTET